MLWAFQRKFWYTFGHFFGHKSDETSSPPIFTANDPSAQTEAKEAKEYVSEELHAIELDDITNAKDNKELHELELDDQTNSTEVQNGSAVSTVNPQTNTNESKKCPPATKAKVTSAQIDGQQSNGHTINPSKMFARKPQKVSERTAWIPKKPFNINSSKHPNR